MLFNVSLGPAGGAVDSKANEIALSSGIHSMRGLIYFFFYLNSVTLFSGDNLPFMIT
jgi:hypothetical protein